MEKPKSGVFFLKTRDLEKTTAFYAGVMDFKLALDQSQCRIFRIRAGCFVGFCFTEGSTGSEEVVLTIEMDDVDGFCRYLEGKGVEIEVRPRLNERYNIYQMFVRDPNGYLVEIQRFLDPQWRNQDRD